MKHLRLCINATTRQHSRTNIKTDSRVANAPLDFRFLLKALKIDCEHKEKPLKVHFIQHVFAGKFKETNQYLHMFISISVVPIDFMQRDEGLWKNFIFLFTIHMENEVETAFIDLIIN